MASSDETPEMTVPLVVYRSGRRMVIGTATIKGHNITGVLDRDAAEEFKDIITHGLTTEVSVGPFRIPRRRTW